MGAQSGTLDGAGRDDELLPEHRVLREQVGARTGQIGDEPAYHAARPANVA